MFLIKSIFFLVFSVTDQHNLSSLIFQDKARCPQLFLYSRADKLINYNDVEYFVAERQKLGVPVVTKCWDDSAHVQHYRYVGNTIIKLY